MKFAVMKFALGKNSLYYAPVTKIVFCTFMNFRVGPSYFELFLKFSSCYSIPRLFLLTVGVASTFLNLFEEDTQEAIWITFGGQGQKRSWCFAGHNTAQKHNWRVGRVGNCPPSFCQNSMTAGPPSIRKLLTPL